MNAHRKDIRKVLIDLFETAVPKSDHAGRAVLSRILCNPDEDFTTPLLDVSTNIHITPMVSAGVRVCLWQDPAKKASGCKSILCDIVSEGQELLADFIGTCISNRIC